MSRGSLTTKQEEQDVDAIADEVLSYSTGCDRQLAQTIVILEEQKDVAVEALDSCKVKRDKALEDQNFLTTKLHLTQGDLDTVEERYDEKLNAAKAEAQNKVNEVMAQLVANDATMAELRSNQTAQLEDIALTHESSLEELKKLHLAEVKEIHKIHENVLNELKREIESLEDARKVEKAEHEKGLKAMESDWSKRVERNLEVSNQKIKSMETTFDKQVEDLQKKLKQTEKSLQVTVREKQSCELRLNNAFQKIEVLENVTALTLAEQEVKDLYSAVSKETYSLVYPVYEEHLKDSVEKIKAGYRKIKPHLKPVTQPLSRGIRKAMDFQKQFLSSAFASTLDFFEKDICPKGQAKLNEWKHKNVFDSPLLIDYTQKACSEPDHFLIVAGKILLGLLVFLLRNVILRTMVSLFLLPFVFFFYLLTWPFQQASPENPGKDSEAEVSNGIIDQ